MPVFHTKTIRSILEPVAQQVSHLVILHEEAEDGNAMPDLSQSIATVAAAVDNLVKVANETSNTTNDEILREDMPPAAGRVSECAALLLEASRMLAEDPFSVDARKSLIEGAAGIIQGTSSLLLAFDESEVRNIVKVCNNVLKYISVAEVLESMDDLVTFVKNVSPVLTKMVQDVGQRKDELTHQPHCEWLDSSLHQIKSLTPVLISSMKTFVSMRESGSPEMAEARQNRNSMVRKLEREIEEVIRVLQLQSYDEDELEEDELMALRKAQASLNAKMQQAYDWLQNPLSMPGDAGDKAIQGILNGALRMADKCSNPDHREAIVKSVSGIESLRQSLNELKAKGEGNSPQAQTLARAMQEQLGRLQKLVADVVQDTEKGGALHAARTLRNKVAKGQQWLDNPTQADGGVGEQAIQSVVAEGRKLANSASYWKDKDDLLKQCNEVEALAMQLSSLKKKGMGNTPHAKEIARNLNTALCNLETKMGDVLVGKLVDDFLDINTPLKKLSEAALAPSGTPQREATFNTRAGEFMQHSAKLTKSARMFANQAVENRHAMETINATATHTDDVAAQVLRSAKIVLLNPHNKAAAENFELVKQQWFDNADRLRSILDDCTDTASFIRASEEGILRDTAKVEDGIRSQTSPEVVENTVNIARRANRVLQVANQDAENSEDKTFVSTVTAATGRLHNQIPQLVKSVKELAGDLTNGTKISTWRGQSKGLMDAVVGVRKAIAPAYDVPDMSQLHMGIPPIPPAPPVTISVTPEEAPPRPPLPTASAPPRPPLPDQDAEMEKVFEQRPQDNQPILMAAHNLHQEVANWDSRDNEIIAAAKRMALLMAKLSQLVRGEGGGTKRDLIGTAKEIAAQSAEVTALAKALAAECTDKRMRTNLLQVCERIPTIGTQLKILSTVKATMLGAQGSEEDQEATEMLVGNAQNLMQSVRDTVRAAEAASIKIRVDSGYSINWSRRKPWYTT